MLIVNMIHNVSASHNKITITQRGNSRDCVELEHLVEDDPVPEPDVEERPERYKRRDDDPCVRDAQRGAREERALGRCLLYTSPSPRD